MRGQFTEGFTVGSETAPEGVTRSGTVAGTRCSRSLEGPSFDEASVGSPPPWGICPGKRAGFLGSEGLREREIATAWELAQEKNRTVPETISNKKNSTFFCIYFYRR
jgi:hypothetical protein